MFAWQQQRRGLFRMTPLYRYLLIRLFRSSLDLWSYGLVTMVCHKTVIRHKIRSALQTYHATIRLLYWSVKRVYDTYKVQSCDDCHRVTRPMQYQLVTLSLANNILIYMQYQYQVPVGSSAWYWYHKNTRH